MSSKEAVHYEYSAMPIRVIDGDTIVMEVDLGFRMKTTQSFRLLGINCPEKRGDEAEHGKLCTKFVQRTLDAGVPHAGFWWNVQVITHKNPDSFGRWLAEVYVDGKNLVEDILIPGGWGVRWNGKGKAPRPWIRWDKYPNDQTGE